MSSDNPPRYTPFDSENSTNYNDDLRSSPRNTQTSNPILVNPPNTQQQTQPQTQQPQSAQQHLQSPQKQPEIKLSLRTLTGQILVVTLPNLNFTVLQFKQKVEELHNIPASFQRLIFGGRELQDESSLTSYNLSDGMMIHLLLRQNQPPPEQAAPIDPSNFPIAPSIAIPIAAQPAAPVVGDTNILACYALGRTVKLFALIDAIFLILWATRFPIILIAIPLCVAGYIGAARYQSTYVACFVLYLILSIAARAWFIYYYFDAITAVLLGIGILIEIYILRLTVQFMNMLKNLTEQDRGHLYGLARAQNNWI